MFNHKDTKDTANLKNTQLILRDLLNEKCKNLVRFPHIGRNYDSVSPGL